MTIVSSPGPTVRQVSGKDPEGCHILSVLAKRTYRVRTDGHCELTEEQQPLCEEPQDDDKTGCLAMDCDLYPFKLATDVVVRGNAWAPNQLPRSKFTSRVSVGGCQKSLLVMGNRKCTSSATGRPVISEPEVIEKVPLDLSRAYGGRDRLMEQRNGNPFLALQPYLVGHQWDLNAASPYVYPRNPFGTGYLIEGTRESFEQLALPNLEDPADLLGPDRLSAGHPGMWMRMPIPHSTDWLDYRCFPRHAYLGIIPYSEPFNEELPESVRGFAPNGLLDDGNMPDDLISLRLASGASLGLQIPFLQGGEIVELQNLHASQSLMRIRLPKERPLIWTDGRKGKLAGTNPVIHSLIIEPDAAILNIVWRGSSQALRPYLPEELEKMPLKVEWN